MTEPKAIAELPVIEGWRVFVSDVGRLWANRAQPFTSAQIRAGAERLVDADDEMGLREQVAKMEKLVGDIS